MPPKKGWSCMPLAPAFRRAEANLVYKLQANHCDTSRPCLKKGTKPQRKTHKHTCAQDKEEDRHRKGVVEPGTQRQRWYRCVHKPKTARITRHSQTPAKPWQRSPQDKPCPFKLYHWWSCASETQETKTPLKSHEGPPRLWFSTCWSQTPWG